MKKVSTLSVVSLIFSVIALTVCYCNFNGQLSEQYRNVNQINFYGILGGPVVLAGIALGIGVVARVALLALIEMKKKDEE